MENNNCWDTFTKTGRVNDYLEYAKNNHSSAMNSRKEERGQRERTSDGDGTVSRYHW